MEAIANQDVRQYWRMGDNCWPACYQPYTATGYALHHSILSLVSYKLHICWKVSPRPIHFCIRWTSAMGDQTSPTHQVAQQSSRRYWHWGFERERWLLWLDSQIDASNYFRWVIIRRNPSAYNSTPISSFAEMTISWSFCPTWQLFSLLSSTLAWDLVIDLQDSSLTTCPLKLRLFLQKNRHPCFWCRVKSCAGGDFDSILSVAPLGKGTWWLRRTWNFDLLLFLCHCFL